METPASEATSDDGARDDTRSLFDIFRDIELHVAYGPATDNPTPSRAELPPPPQVQPIRSRLGRYRLLSVYEPPPLGGLCLQILPGADPHSSFFNGASVPLLFWWILRPMDPRVVEAALVHDALYASGGLAGPAADTDGRTLPLSRYYADLAFLQLMRQAGLPPWRRWLAFIAVRTFSKGHFRPLAQPTAVHEAVLEAEARERELARHLLESVLWSRVRSITTLFSAVAIFVPLALAFLVVTVMNSADLELPVACAAWGLTMLLLLICLASVLAATIVIGASAKAHAQMKRTSAAKPSEPSVVPGAQP